MIRASDEYADAVQELLDREQFQEALDLAREGLRRFSGDSMLRHYEAFSMIRVGHIVSAREAIEELLRDASSDKCLLLTLADAYLYLGRRRDAIHCARRSFAQMDAGDSEGAAAFVRVFWEHAFFEEAARCAALAIRLHFGSAEAWYLLGVNLFQLDRDKASAHCFQRAVELDAGCLDAKAALGYLRFAAGRHEDAIALWSKVPVKEHFSPGVLEAWLGLISGDDPLAGRIRKRLKRLRPQDDPIFSEGPSAFLPIRPKPQK